ncbi:MAG TPA: hypothetical protein PLH23_18740 [Hyphomonadaceae bacterium]|nr:hypothetical protein [Hyphomonadaceae bacterium]HPI50317.1 hypothetical protein [Hyphomonadaceae bacterium]
MRMTWAVVTALACVAILAAPILAQSPVVESTTAHIARTFGLTTPLDQRAESEVSLTSATLSE